MPHCIESGYLQGGGGAPTPVFHVKHAGVAYGWGVVYGCAIAEGGFGT